MTTLTISVQDLRGQNVTITEDMLSVDLADGRTISVPLVWYPRLVHATQSERQNWRWIGDRVGIHWPDLDEDISIQNLIVGQPSGESQKSFQRWLEQRRDTTENKDEEVP